MLLIGYLYGITSERRLCEDVRMHLAYRWFLGLGFDQAVPHHSTFSKNRHGRFRESGLFHHRPKPQETGQAPRPARAQTHLKDEKGRPERKTNARKINPAKTGPPKPKTFSTWRNSGIGPSLIDSGRYSP